MKNIRVRITINDGCGIIPLARFKSTIDAWFFAIKAYKPSMPFKIKVEAVR